MIVFELSGKIQGLAQDFATRRVTLTLSINEEHTARRLFDELRNAEKLSIKVDMFRQKRSLNANSYCWKLIGDLSEKLNIPKEEIYRKYIKEMGVYRKIEIDEKAVDTIIHVWGLNGIGWIAEKVDFAEREGFVSVFLYYGSSTYNTKQMSRLIDSVVTDCKEQGIETKTPAELASLIDLWGAR